MLYFGVIPMMYFKVILESIPRYYLSGAIVAFDKYIT